MHRKFRNYVFVTAVFFIFIGAITLFNPTKSDAAQDGEPFTYRDQIIIEEGYGGQSGILYYVPAGKRLVIEYVSFVLSNPLCSEEAHVKIYVGPGGGGLGNGTAPLQGVKSSGIGSISAGAKVLLHANTEDYVLVGISRDYDDYDEYFYVTISGFLFPEDKKKK